MVGALPGTAGKLVKLGMLGGTFDPVHVGHLILGEIAREQCALDRIVFVPTGYSWRKADREISPGPQRLEMLRLATADNPCFEVSTLEIDREGPSYTDVTLEALKSANPEVELYFILGRDALADLPHWKAPQRIVELATLVVANRPGEGALPPAQDVLPDLSARMQWVEMPHVEVSASAVRNRVREGRSIRYLVPDGVREYIGRHGLYR